MIVQLEIIHSQGTDWQRCKKQIIIQLLVLPHNRILRLADVPPQQNEPLKNAVWKKHVEGSNPKVETEAAH